MDRVKATMRVKRYSPRTEKTYCYWIRYFIRFHGVRHPASMGASEARIFLEHLAVERQVAAAIQNQALNAIVFLYRHVLEQPLGEIGEFSRAKLPRRLPVVLPHALDRKYPNAGISLSWQWLFSASRPCCGLDTHVLGNGFAGVRSPLG